MRLLDASWKINIYSLKKATFKDSISRMSCCFICGWFLIKTPSRVLAVCQLSYNFSSSLLITKKRGNGKINLICHHTHVRARVQFSFFDLFSLLLPFSLLAFLRIKSLTLHHVYASKKKKINIGIVLLNYSNH